SFAISGEIRPWMTASRTALSLMLLNCASDEIVSPAAGAPLNGAAGADDAAGVDAGVDAAGAGDDAGLDGVAVVAGVRVGVDAGAGVVGVPVHDDRSPASVPRRCATPSLVLGLVRSSPLAEVNVVVVVVVVDAALSAAFSRIPFTISSECASKAPGIPVDGAAGFLP